MSNRITAGVVQRPNKIAGSEAEVAKRAVPPPRCFSEQFRAVNTDRQRRLANGPDGARVVSVANMVTDELDGRSGFLWRTPEVSPSQLAIVEPDALTRDPGASHESHAGWPHGPDVSADPSLTWCDSMARSLLQWAPPPNAQNNTAPATVSPTVLDQIANQLVRKAAIGASSVHLQFGAGKLEGGEMLVQAGADGLDIRITPPRGVCGADIATAISERLSRRGVMVSQIVVD